MNGSCRKAEIKGIERSNRVFIVMKNSTSSWLLWLRDFSENRDFVENQDSDRNGSTAKWGL